MLLNSTFTANLIGMKECPIRMLAGFVGMIVSLIVIAGNCCRLTTRFCQIAIAEATSWECKIALSNTILEEIKFWHQNIVILNNKFLFDKKQNAVAQIICFNAHNQD